ncbi:MAG TPA: hypothetical protein VH440_00150, partial [Candidatus Limnocylindrales bacterium]
MAADLRFERQLGEWVRDSLDAVSGPHPVWSGAPAAAVVAGHLPRPVGRIRRPSRTMALLAAVVAIAVVATAIIAGGGFRPGPGPGLSDSR